MCEGSLPKTRAFSFPLLPHFSFLSLLISDLLTSDSISQEQVKPHFSRVLFSMVFYTEIILDFKFHSEFQEICNWNVDLPKIEFRKIPCVQFCLASWLKTGGDLELAIHDIWLFAASWCFRQNVKSIKHEHNPHFVYSEPQFDRGLCNSPVNFVAHY